MQKCPYYASYYARLAACHWTVHFLDAHTLTHQAILYSAHTSYWNNTPVSSLPKACNSCTYWQKYLRKEREEESVGMVEPKWFAANYASLMLQPPPISSVLSLSGFSFKWHQLESKWNWVKVKLKLKFPHVGWKFRLPLDYGSLATWQFESCSDILTPFPTLNWM